MSKKGFVTFVNNNEKYIKLNDILVESVLEFTDLNIEVNSINFDYKHSNPRVISKKIILNNECIDTIFYSKIYSSYSSDFEIGLQLDADIIVTPDVMNLFNCIDENYQYIKGPKHPWNGPLTYSHLSIMNYLNVLNQSQPYIHADCYLFTKNSEPFLKEAYSIGMNMFLNDIHPINYDETILNALLWKNDVKDGFVDCCDPYYEYFKNNIGMPTGIDCTPPYSTELDFKINYYVCHGCKNYEESKLIFEKLKKIYCR